MTRQLYRIGAILNKETNEPKSESQYRVGRFGFLLMCDIGQRFTFHYTTFEVLGGVVTSSVVEDIMETDYGLRITTQNSVYRLDNADFVAFCGEM